MPRVDPIGRRVAPSRSVPTLARLPRLPVPVGWPRRIGAAQLPPLMPLSGRRRTACTAGGARHTGIAPARRPCIEVRGPRENVLIGKARGADSENRRGRRSTESPFRRRCAARRRHRGESAAASRRCARLPAPITPDAGTCALTHRRRPRPAALRACAGACRSCSRIRARSIRASASPRVGGSIRARHRRAKKGHDTRFEPLTRSGPPSAGALSARVLGGQPAASAIERALALGPARLRREPVSALDSASGRYSCCSTSCGTGAGSSSCSLARPRRGGPSASARVVVLGRLVEEGPGRRCPSSRCIRTRALRRRRRPRSEQGVALDLQEGEPPSAGAAVGCHFHPRCPFVMPAVQAMRRALRSRRTARGAICSRPPALVKTPARTRTCLH